MKIHCTKQECGIRPGIRTVYVFDELNAQAESLVIELGRSTVPNEWKKRGLINPSADYRVRCSVEFRDSDGHAFGGESKDYDPTMRRATAAEQGKVTGCGYMTNFDWILEDTPANRERILQEIQRRFYVEESIVRFERDPE